MAKTTYKVSGMTCEGCARAVKKAIGAAAPGAAVDVDRTQGRVTVDPSADPAVVRKAVEAAGFSFEGLA